MNIARFAGAAAAATWVLALSACGALPNDDGFLEQSPRDMAKTAFADMRKTTSLRMLGSTETDSGFVRFDVSLDATDCTARLRTDDGNVRIIKNREGVWFQADERFWRSQAPSPRAADIVATYRTSWVAVKKPNELVDLCDLDALLRGFRLDKSDTTETIHVGEVEEVGNVRAVAIQGRDKKQRVTVWAAVDAPHRVLKMVPTDDEGMPDEFFFQSFDVAVDAQSPPEKDIVRFPGV